MQTSHEMKQLAIDPLRCRVCARCLVSRACRGMAVLRFGQEEAPVIDPARCKHCLVCIDQCPFQAVVWT